jgi:SAM-dependent methyltransferase
MSKVEEWKARVRASLAAEPQAPPPDKTWDARRAAWFNRFAGHDDRSPTYRFIEPHVRGQVLEVGPGPGAYTRLLVAQAQRVVAVEPSPSMVQQLRQNLPGASNLVIVPSTIEDYLPHLDSYDLALAANVLSGIERIDEVLCALAGRAALLSVVIRTRGEAPAWSRAVQSRFGLEPPKRDRVGGQDLLAVLDELGLRYAVHVADVPVHTFSRREDVVDWVEGFFTLPPARHGELEQVLAPHIEERGGKYGLASGSETLVINVRGLHRGQR